MPRRVVIAKKQIYKRRSSSWDYHYSLRQQAALMTANGRGAMKISDMLARSLARPQLRIDGGLVDLSAADRLARRSLVGQLEIFDEDLLCWFWWTEAAWMEYVREFQCLPDPVEDWYLTYNEATDQALLVPMSFREVRQVHPKYNSGTSEVVVPRDALEREKARWAD